MAAMKQKLAPSQHLLGGEHKVQSLVENNVRKLETAVKRVQTTADHHPQPTDTSGVSSSNVLACMKGLSQALSKNGSSTATALLSNTRSPEGYSDLAETIYGSVAGQKPSGGDSEVALLSGNANVQHRATGQYTHTNGESQTAVQAAPTRNDDDLRAKLLSQVSNLSTEALMNLVFAQKGSVATPSIASDVRRGSLSLGESQRGSAAGQPSVPEHSLADLQLLTTIADQNLLRSLGAGQADPLQLLASTATDQNQPGLGNRIGADDLLAGLLLAQQQEVARREADAIALASASRKRSFSGMDSSTASSADGAARKRNNG